MRSQPLNTASWGYKKQRQKKKKNGPCLSQTEASNMEKLDSAGR